MDELPLNTASPADRAAAGADPAGTADPVAAPAADPASAPDPDSAAAADPDLDPAATPAAGTALAAGDIATAGDIAAAGGIAIKLIGIGDAGANVVGRLEMENPGLLRRAIINTDHRTLSASPVRDKVLIGRGVTRGLGTGGDPALGRAAAEADREKIAAAVRDCDLVLLVAGMGGGTGGAAAPLVAEEAAGAGAGVIAFVTMPFSFEGGRRAAQAAEGLAALRKACDAVVPLPNNLLLQEAGEDEGVPASFTRADQWIGRGVRALRAMMDRTGLINLDYAALRRAFTRPCGKTLFGLGAGAGENAARDAIDSLHACPLLHAPEFSRKADRLLVSIIGGADLTLPKVNDIMAAVSEKFVSREAHITLGAVIDEAMPGRIEVCVIGTADDSVGPRMVRPPARPSVSAPARAPGPARPGPVPPPPGKTPAPDGVPPGPGAVGGRLPGRPPAPEGQGRAPAPPAVQNEFGFTKEEKRGPFEETDRNLFEGQDLDVPTFFRKGVKITP
ncbi:MAG: cell division FtsZ family protein [Opitutaceae bacterium]|jgi:cell division protein FtsZ|nr:cell division FtsZ family protein [Opitutaceae bacterium]